MNFVHTPIMKVLPTCNLLLKPGQYYKKATQELSVIYLKHKTFKMTQGRSGLSLLRNLLELIISTCKLSSWMSGMNGGDF